MRYQKKKAVTAPKKPAAKKQKQPVPNVVSLRITDQERLALEGITQATSRSVSEVVREAISFWLAMRQRVLSP